MRNQSILFMAIISGAFSILAISCSKDEPQTPSPVQLAVITIDEPEVGVTIEFDDTVHMHIHIVGAEDLHGYEVDLINVTEGDTVADFHFHDHGLTFDIEEFWVNNVVDHSDMQLRVKAIVDHDDNFVEKVVEFHCHPL